MPPNTITVSAILKGHRSLYLTKPADVHTQELNVQSAGYSHRFNKIRCLE